ncbi:MAG: hypothetical protein QM761_12805 [Pseudoxanthomonas sp.]
MNRIGTAITAAMAGIALTIGGAAAAIELANLDDFKEHFGRYAPGGDCKRQPQVVIDRDGFAFEGGPPLEKAIRPIYAASYMGNFYEGISLFFFPYTKDPKPFLLTLNANEEPGTLEIGVFDYDYPGGPTLPARYRPYIDASPYRKCR